MMTPQPPPRPPTTPGPTFVTVRGGQFLLDGHPWFPYGVNYCPHDGGATGGDHDRWLRRRVYAPQRVEQDLALLAELGFNCLVVRGCQRRDSWANLRDFLIRCRRHHLKLNLLLDADPFDAGIATLAERRCEEIVRVLELDRSDVVFSYTLAWDPRLGTWRRSRNRLDGVWSRWIRKTYGDLAAARRALPGLASSRAGPCACGLIAHDVPVRAVAGEAYEATVVMRNLSSDTPWPAGGEVRLGRWLEGGVAQYSPLPRRIGPGRDASFTFVITAPATPGRYLFRANVIRGSSQWFGPVLEHEIEVVASSGVPVQKAIYFPEPVLAPSDEELTAAQPADVVLAYRRAIDSEIAARYGQLVGALRRVDPHHLITVRQGPACDPTPRRLATYPVPLAATAHHLDFLSPENLGFAKDVRYVTIAGHMAAVDAYCRWASVGKPVVWIAVGYQGSPRGPDPGYLENQTLYHRHFIAGMIHQTGANGAAFQWGPRSPRPAGRGRDWGLSDPHRTLRPAALATRAGARQATAPRLLTQPLASRTFDPYADPRFYHGIHRAIHAYAHAAVVHGSRFTVRSVGDGRTSADPDPRLAGFAKHLWADLTRIEIRLGDQGEWIEVRDGRAYAVPRMTPLQVRAEIVNLGEAVWLPRGEGAAGEVAFAGDPRAGLGFRVPISERVPRGGRLHIPPHPLTAGIPTDTDVQFGILARDRGWASGAVLVHLLTQ